MPLKVIRTISTFSYPTMYLMATLLAAGTAVLRLSNADMSGCPSCFSRTVQGIP